MSPSTAETMWCRMMIPTVLLDLTDKEADQLIGDGIIWEYRGWRTFTRKGFQQFIDNGTCVHQMNGNQIDGITLTFYYRRSGSGFLSAVWERLCRWTHWLLRW